MRPILAFILIAVAPVGYLHSQIPENRFLMELNRQEPPTSQEWQKAQKSEQRPSPSATSPEISAQVETWLNEAEKLDNSSPRKYALLQLAEEYAYLAKSIPFARRAAVQRANSYREIRGNIFVELTRQSATLCTAEQRSEFVGETLALAHLLIQEDEFESAAKIGRLALESANKEPNGPLPDRVKAFAARLRQSREKYTQFLEACSKLEFVPKDKRANLIVARWLVFEKEDYRQAAAYLTLVDDTALRELVDLERLRSSTPQQRMALARNWAQRAASADFAERALSAQRAKHWHTLAIGDLPAEQRRKFTEELTSLGVKL